MISQFLFEPVLFFESRMEKSPLWFLALAGPGLCFFLRSIVSSVLLNKTIRALASAVPDAIQPSFMHPLMPVLAAFSSSYYFFLWLLSAGFLVCVDILIKDCGSYYRLVELIGISFWSQLPYLLTVLVIALLFVPPVPPQVLGTSAEELRQFAIDYAQSVSRTAHFRLIRNLGFAFDAWLFALFAFAYRAFSRKSLKLSFSLVLFMYGAFFLPGLVFKG